MSIENIFKQFNDEICSNCANKKECKEELRIKIDGSIKCDRYERIKREKPIGALISMITIGD